MKKTRSYDDKTHLYGRIWMTSALILILSVPVWIGIVYNAWPDASIVFKGLLGVAPIFWTVAVIEVLTYVPMLGPAGSYLGFVTGNLTNLKIPCLLNAMDLAKVKPGTAEGEVISTIAIGISSITTTIILALGVLMLSRLEPILNSPTLAPAFDNILPALFGGLAVVFIAKSWKIAIAPLAFMVILFIAVPGLASSVGILVPVGSVIAISVARILYKKNIL